ncbi:MAG: hypothetical protein HN348_11080, partial [Proteobacteria bacterium]|nr:hypothetical protein [Pseudomonadota bacterium]
MSDEMFRGQGSVIPTLFIGMGGTGSRIVDRIASRAKLMPNWESQLQPLTNFVVVDTNELDQHALEHVPRGNRINIAAFDKSKVVEGYRRSLDAQALHWLDPVYRPRPGTKPGAGQIRVESRLGFFFRSPNIRERLKQIVQSSLRPGITWRQSNPAKYYVYLFQTLAGGTGSGSFLSMAYLVDNVIREQGWEPRVIGNHLLSTLLLERVGSKLHPDIHANTYAALKELEHLTKLRYDEVKRKGRSEEEFAYWRDANSDEVSTVKTSPFFLSFIHDNPVHVDLPDFEAAIGDASFLKLFTPLIEKVQSGFDNYEKRNFDLTRFPGHLKNVGEGYTKDFGAVGVAVLRLPATDLHEYCALRFAAEAIRTQITFGVAEGESQDERARTLAALAIDYADPKFMRMSESAREERINDSFQASVRALAKLDEEQEELDGFWYRLVERTDQGKDLGLDPKTNEKRRGESLLDEVKRRLNEEREPLINKVNVKARTFVFMPESVNQYLDLVSRLKKDIAQAKSTVDEGLEQMRVSAQEGRVISRLALSPIHERYLVLRLLDACEKEWIPAAAEALEKAESRSLENSGVRDRLENELWEQLQAAAQQRGWFGRKNDSLLASRDEAQGYYRTVARATKRVLDAKVELAQFRALFDYLTRRSRQYSRLSISMNDLYKDLEASAERFRRGEVRIEQPYALQVEVFETLSEPRSRIWDHVYHHLYASGARYLTTFDRKTLAGCISEQLTAKVSGDGRLLDKTVDEMVHDIREALIALGHTRTRDRLYGGDREPGLDLERGLKLEASLMLTEPGELDGPTDAEITTYVGRKLTAMTQLVGVFAKLDTAQAAAWDDNVTVDSKRRVAVVRGMNPAENKFIAQMQDVLSIRGLDVEVVDELPDPRIAIVQDVEIGVPLYYFQSIVGAVERAYLSVASDEKRSFNLHTDFNWEESLPNLNPKRSEIAVGWSIEKMVEGLLSTVIQRNDTGIWVWRVGEGEEDMPLGNSLSSALYALAKIHREPDALRSFEVSIDHALRQVSKEDITSREQQLTEQLD